MTIRTSISDEIGTFNSRMMGYVGSLQYSYCQLCVIAEPSALLPFEVQVGGELKHIEDLADVIAHNKKQDGDNVTFDILPKSSTYISNIVQGLMQCHPEFKISMQTEKTESVEGDDEMSKAYNDAQKDEDVQMSHKYIQAVMPPVDKDRRDVLNDLVDILREKCKTQCDAAKVKTLAAFVPLCVGVPKDEVEEAKKQIDKAYEFYVKGADQATEDKKNQIEEAYQEYIKQHPEAAYNDKEKKAQDAAAMKSTKTMKL